MPVTKSQIGKNLRRIQADIAEACERVRRDPGEVSVLAVTKAVDMATIRNLIDLGVCDLGESHVQQLLERVGELGDSAGDVRWHMVGHLQRNKARQALQAAATIHSVDSLRLAEELNNRAERMDRTVDVFLQINCSREEQKFGVAIGAAMHLAELIGTLRELRLVGLMTMAPIVADPEEARPSFVCLRELFEEMRHEKIVGEAFRHLSMGMSQDYVVAVEEGATILRIGTALFA